jgi:hypothetical protein
MLLTEDEAARLALAQGTELLNKIPSNSMSIKDAQAALDPAVRRSAQRLVNAGKTPTHLIVSSVVQRLIKGGRTSYAVTCKVGDAIRRFKLEVCVDPHLPGDLVVMDRAVKLNRAQRAELNEIAEEEGPGVA